MKLKTLTLAFVLAGCAMNGGLHYAPQFYTDYREMLTDHVWRMLEKSKVSGAPESVKEDYAKCGAQAAWIALPLDQQIKLDEYAQQKRGMTAAELQEADQTIRQFWGPFTFDKLRPICPEHIEEFKAAFHGTSPDVF